jgi:hypothetical protein
MHLPRQIPDRDLPADASVTFDGIVKFGEKHGSTKPIEAQI